MGPTVAASNPFDDFDLDDLQHLSEEEQALFHQSMEMLVGGETNADWINRVFPEEPTPRHVLPICEVLDAARLRPQRVVLDYGAGHAKTTTAMRCIAHWIERSPADLCAYVSYSDDQARDKSAIAKAALERINFKLATSTESDSHWKTKQGGGLIAMGARGGLMGKRIPGLFVYDDAYKDVQEARSPAINGAVIGRFKAAGFTRLQGGSIVIIGSRLDENDLIGYILKHLKWDHISCPAICEDELNDPLGRKKGEAAWPEKYPIEICSEPCGHDGHLAEIKRTIGDHLFSAIYQGRPRPEGTAIFHEPGRFRLKNWTDQETGAVYPSEFKWEGKRGVISIDPAATAKKQSDWSVLATCAMFGYGIEAFMWVVDLVRIQVEIPDLVARGKRMQNLTRLLVACEAVAGFKGVPQSLRSIDARDPDTGKPIGRLRVLDIPGGLRDEALKSLFSRDKFTKAQPGAAAWNDGRILVPIDAPWAEPMIERFQRFTGVEGGEDDEIDAVCQGWNVLYRPSKPKGEERDYDGGVV